MKSSRLVSTTERYCRQALERSSDIGEREVRRVEALDAIEGDRQRSLRQELDAADPDGHGAPGGDDHVRHDAQEVTAQLLKLPEDAKARLTRPLLPDGFYVVDEKA